MLAKKQLSQGIGFLETIRSVLRTNINRSSSNKDKGENFGQQLSAVVHIVTASALINASDQKKPKITEYDYTKTVFSFFASTLLIAVVLSLLTHIPLILSQRVIGYLSSELIESYFFTLLAIKFMSEVISALVSCVMGIYQKYIKETIVKSIRGVLIDSVEKYQVSEPTTRAYFDDIPAIVSHLSVMIQYVTFVFFYAAYALSHMDIRLVLVAALIGGCAKTLNKGISCMYQLASDYAMQVKSGVRNTLVTLLSPKMLEKIKGINAYASLKAILKQENESMFGAQLKVGIYEEIAGFFAQLVKSISHNSYLIYFGFALASGYITVIEMMILLPFAEQVSECAARAINIPIISAYTQMSIQNLKRSWNAVVDSEYKVPNNFSPVKFSSKYYFAYATLSMIVIPLFLMLFPALSPKVALLLWGGVSAYSILRPRSSTSQIFCYLLLVVDYPFRWIMSQLYTQSSRDFHQNSGKGEKTNVSSIQESVTFQDGANSYRLEHEVIDLTNDPLAPMLVRGENGIGKTRTFGGIVPGKLNQQGLYPADKSIHLTDNSQLMGWEKIGALYSTCLAETYAIDEETIACQLEGFCEKTRTKNKELGQGLQSAINSISGQSAPSTGQQQILNALAGLWKAAKGQFQYLCCDEAVSGLTPTNKEIFYHYMDEHCISHSIKRVLIDPSVPSRHGYTAICAQREQGLEQACFRTEAP